jgi:hypothetical protein
MTIAPRQARAKLEEAMRSFAHGTRATTQRTVAGLTRPATLHRGLGPVGSHDDIGQDFSRISVHPKPSPTIRATLGSLTEAALPADKITQKDRAKSDQSIGSTVVAATTSGVDVTAEAQNLVSSPDFPDGFRWLQTVTTNDPSNTPVGAPLLPTPISYVDPLPNDDTKPFYWTDAEEAKNLGHFSDQPGRPAHPTGTITWDAVLSLGGVKGTDVTRFDSVTYGFSIDSAGKVSTRGPGSPLGVASHIATLSGEFPGWTFKP